MKRTSDAKTTMHLFLRALLQCNPKIIKMRSGYQERDSGYSHDSERNVQDLLKILRRGSASMIERQTSLLGKEQNTLSLAALAQYNKVLLDRCQFFVKSGGLQKGDLSSDQAGASRLMTIR
jgi:hypothetical protein